jgi:hypothetical protein
VVCMCVYMLYIYIYIYIYILLCSVLSSLFLFSYALIPVAGSVFIGLLVSSIQWKSRCGRC